MSIGFPRENLAWHGVTCTYGQTFIQTTTPLDVRNMASHMEINVAHQFVMSQRMMLCEVVTVVLLAT